MDFGGPWSLLSSADGETTSRSGSFSPSPSRHKPHQWEISKHGKWTRVGASQGLQNSGKEK